MYINLNTPKFLSLVCNYFSWQPNSYRHHFLLTEFRGNCSGRGRRDTSL